jgi:hypothetical protein
MKISGQAPVYVPAVGTTTRSKKARAGLKFERQANHSDCADFARAERRGAQETQCCDPSEMVGRQRRQGDLVTATGEKCWFMAATLVAQACRLLYVCTPLQVLSYRREIMITGSSR